MFVNGASGKHSLGGRVVLISPQGVSIEQAVALHFPVTNNQAEYEAVIAGLRLAKELGVHDVELFTDSLVVASQIRGEYEARESTLLKYLSKVRMIIGGFRAFSIQHVPSEENEAADRLAKFGPRRGEALTELFHPAIEEGELMEVDRRPSWVDPFIAFFTTGSLPEGFKEAKGFRLKVVHYLMHEGGLHRKMLSGLFARCVAEEEIPRILEEVHSGECGSHSGVGRWKQG
ncbi:hypothetical protein KSP39_PZI024497 [Platanthera zijinensis]|uniref:RNase H type-1 domain-containing protein n=1 Tax=Platanthera zijinensis TaxID=2320716 RepID=A0AAP0FTZ1_9ASPA